MDFTDEFDHNLNMIFMRKRFGLRDGQFFANHQHKNLWWHLNGELVGYGDLRDEDILNIESCLGPDDVFVGFSEHAKIPNMWWWNCSMDMVRCIIRKGDLDLALRR